MDQCKSHAGIKKEEFFHYFHGKTLAHAIQIKKVKKFTEEINPKDVDPQFRPPQSFSYLQPGQELYEATQDENLIGALDSYL